MIVEDASRVPKDTESQLKFAARKLEELFIYELFKSMRKTHIFNDYPGAGFESQMFWSMWDEGIAQEAAKRESLGLAPVIYRWLKNQLEAVPPKRRIVAITPANRAPNESKLDALMAKISSPFGWRTHPIYGHRQFHTGIDIALPKGHPIRAPVSGTVVFAGRLKGYGNTVILRTGSGQRMLFAHMNRIDARAGDTVSAGCVLGTVGDSGLATGPHLHLEIREDGRPIDPLSDKTLALAIERALLQPEGKGG